MPPLILRVHVLAGQGRETSLWFPLFVLWLLLLPIVVLILPFLFVVCVVIDVDPFAALAAAMDVLKSLRGSHVEIDAADTSVFVHVY
jgi:hypothetical protein